MKQHLESGYKSCDVVESYFAKRRIEGEPLPFPRVARLVFDSFGQSAPGAVRSHGLSPHHYVYRSGSIIVDIKTTPADEAAHFALMGQVLDLSSPVQVVSDTLVKLRNGDADISAAVTNQFGEFHFVIGRVTKPDLQLIIGNDEKTTVIILLRLIGEAQAGR